jgi:hypothetical protein
MGELYRVSLEAAAYHAAGHAVISIVQGLEIHSVTVLPGSNHNGANGKLSELNATHRLASDIFELYRQSLVEKKARSYLAGRIAQRRFNARSWRSHHDDGDSDRARSLLDGMTGGSERATRAWLKLLWIQTEDMVERSWTQIDALARALIQRHTLSPIEARTVYTHSFHSGDHQRA